MIVARNIGRLGNNMLQISCAIGYARKYGYQWAADTGSGLSEPYSCIHKAFPNLPKENWGSGQRYYEHPNAFCPIHEVHKNECHFDYHPIPDLGPNVSLQGFFQSYKYFEGQDEEIKKVFALPVYPEYAFYTSLHIRRGDYVQHSGSFPPIEKGYFNKALDMIHERSGCENLIVFSDDIAWSKTNVDHEEFYIEFSEGRTEREDLAVMASCSHNIIANSTFSWWGSWLNNNPDKIVISPSSETWFGPTAGVKKPVVDLIPPNWIKIPTR